MVLRRSGVDRGERRLSYRCLPRAGNRPIHSRSRRRAAADAPDSTRIRPGRSPLRNTNRPSAILRALALLGLLGLVAAPQAGAQEFQWPEEPENLEVLPDTIGPDGLRQVMSHFTEALGVRCSFCHVGEEGAPLSEYDFASDEKGHKETARVMMRMVRAINSEHLEKLEHGHEGEEHAHGSNTLPPEARVNCVTCHRGASEPALIQDVLADVIEQEGVQAAVERYERLREEYYGGFTYDFQVGPLSELARNLAARGRTDAAVRIADLEAEYHPESYRAHFVLARMLQKAGATERAVESMRRALELAPDEARGFLQRQLKRMQGGG